LLRDRYDKQKACRTAHKFFGKGNANFVAIDGTEYSKPMSDMVVFFAGAYSCEGNITFLEEQEEKITVTYNDKFISRVSEIFQVVYP
jgi:hypothetical protein